jgi:hypothetical protein
MDGDPAFYIYDEDGTRIATGYERKSSRRAVQKIQRRGHKALKVHTQARKSALRAKHEGIFDLERYNEALSKAEGIS